MNNVWLVKCVNQIVILNRNDDVCVLYNCLILQ